MLLVGNIYSLIFDDYELVIFTLQYSMTMRSRKTRSSCILNSFLILTIPGLREITKS